MNKEQFLTVMKIFVQEGGKIVLRYIRDSSPSLKPDQSIITEADKAISVLAHELLKEFLTRGDHILIDEEDEQRGRYLNQAKLAPIPYLWAIDPIDGTRNYANRMPNFGISIGLLKDLKPWLGMVYFPLLNELFYCDGQEAYFVQNAFGDLEHRERIIPVDQVISKQSIFLLTDSFFQSFDWDNKDCHVMIPACAVVDLCWPAIGRGCGAILKSYLWDFAGSWPICHAAGLFLRSLSTGRVLDRLQEDLFMQDPKPWRLKDYYILSSERNYPILKAKISQTRGQKS